MGSVVRILIMESWPSDTVRLAMGLSIGWLRTRTANRGGETGYGRIKRDVSEKEGMCGIALCMLLKCNQYN